MEIKATIFKLYMLRSFSFAEAGVCTFSVSSLPPFDSPNSMILLKPDSVQL